MEKIVRIVSVIVFLAFGYYIFLGPNGYFKNQESNAGNQEREKSVQVKKDVRELLAEHVQNETMVFDVDPVLGLVTFSGSQKLINASLAEMKDRCAYRIDWGDGSSWINYENCSDGFTHQYKEPGSYTVELSLYFLSETRTPIEYWSQRKQVTIN